MTEKFGSGDYCCKSCANTREQSEEIKKKISDSISGKKLYINTITNEIKYFKDTDNIPENFILRKTVFNYKAPKKYIFKRTYNPNRKPSKIRNNDRLICDRLNFDKLKEYYNKKNNIS